MSDTRIKRGGVRPRQKSDNLNDKDFNYTELIQKYNQLNHENQQLNEENRILKDLILQKQDYNLQSTIDDKENVQNHSNSVKGSFYIQIVLGLLVIILSLGFHVVYLAITDCLLYNDGDPSCWIKSWLGISIHASFFIDIFLYLLILLQSILIMLIIRSKINEFRIGTR